MGNKQSEEEREEEEKRKMVFMMTPITPRFHTENIFDFITHTGEGFSGDESNYGFLPVSCVHEILLYLHPAELIVAFSLCKLIYQVSSTNFWWRSYYESYFQKKKIVRKNKEVNWKKQFFKRYYFLTDCFYRERFSKPEENDELMSKPKMIHLFVHGSAKQSEKKDFLEFFQKEFKSSTHYQELNIHDSGRDVSFTIEMSATNSLRIWSSSSITPGVFLCFDIYNRTSFEEVKEIHNALKLGFLDPELSNCILIGFGDENKMRRCEYDEICAFAKKEGVLGYIECDAERKENYFLSFGLLLDGMIRKDGRKMIAKKKLSYQVFVKTLM